MSVSYPAAVVRKDLAEVLLAQDSVRVFVASLVCDPEATATLAAGLSPQEQERVRRFHFERDRRRFIVAHARLRQLLAEQLDTAPDTIEFTVGPHGKPALAGTRHGDGCHFSHSRSGDLAVFAISQARPVGVDVEAMREMRGAEEIVGHCFSRRERLAYRALDPPDKPLGFLNCWTRKEAFVKALGTGMSFSYDRFDVSLAPGEPARLLRVDGQSGDAAGWQLEAFAPREGFVAALASERRAAFSR